MTTTLTRELIDKHGELVHELRDHLADVREGRAEDDTSADEKYDRIERELSAVEKQIRQARRLDEADELDREAREHSDRLVERSGGDPNAANSRAEAERELFRSMIQGEKREGDLWPVARRSVHPMADAESRDLEIKTANAGGETISTGFVDQLYDFMTEDTAIRRLGATVIRTATGNALTFPKVTAHSTAAKHLESIAITESDPTFDTMTLNAYKYGHLVQISHELETDTEVDLVGFLAMDAGRAIADKTGEQAIIGDGTDDPQGIDGVSTLGKTAASNSAITADELIDLQHAVINKYRRRAAWLMEDATLAAVRKLVGSDNNYLWRPGLAQGEPDTILGRPYDTDPNVSAIGSTNKSVFFGDWSTFYVRDVGSVRAERSAEFAFDQDLVTWRFLTRFDCDLIDTTGAIKHLAHPV